jgi:hypothetical protein
LFWFRLVFNLPDPSALAALRLELPRQKGQSRAPVKLSNTMPKPIFPARLLDHVVLAATDLATVRLRLGQLGFSVAPEARHPFGTENACVFLADGTYLEPLAIASREECEASAKAGNVFVARDQAYRFRHGTEGLEAVVFKTEDADGDHAAFQAEGLSAGAMLEFSRPMKLPDGGEHTASFKLAFAADLRSPDFYAFTCQRINVPAMTQSQLTQHENGVLGIAQVVLSEANPSDFQYFLQTIAGQREVVATSFGLELQTANAKLSVMTGAALALHFGQNLCSHSRGLRGRAIVFSVRSLADVASLLRENSVECQTSGNRIVVAPQPGQGVIFAFEETP